MSRTDFIYVVRDVCGLVWGKHKDPRTGRFQDPKLAAHQACLSEWEKSFYTPISKNELDHFPTIIPQCSFCGGPL